MSDFNLLLSKLESTKNEIIELQKNLVSRPAIAPESGGDGEKIKSDYVRGLVRALSPDELIEANAPDSRVTAGYRPNFMAIFMGKNPAKTIWIMMHTDVVPAGDLAQWQSDPFQLQVHGDKIIGRGVEDNHQGFVSAFLALKHMKALRIQPNYNIGLVIVADEECGSQFGLQHIMKYHKNRFKQEDLIIVPDSGDPKGITIEISEKSILWLKFTTTGKQCHASTPGQGINAHRAAANLIVKLDELHSIFAKRIDMFDPPQSTFEPTKKEANVGNVNTIPGEDIFYLDCRLLPEYTIAELLQKIREIADEIQIKFHVKIDIFSTQSVDAPPPTPKGAPVVIALQKAIKEIKQFDAKTIGIGGGTVASFFRRDGLAAAVWSTIEDTAHQPNEYALISSIISDAQVFAYVFLKA